MNGRSRNEKLARRQKRPLYQRYHIESNNNATTTNNNQVKKIDEWEYITAILLNHPQHNE